MGTLFNTLSSLVAANIYPDIVPIVHALLPKFPLLSMFELGAPRRGNEGQVFSWTEDNPELLTGTLNANFVNAAGGITVTAGTFTNFAVGDVVSMRGHIDANGRQPKYLVTSVGASPVLAVSLVAGTGTDTLFTNPTPAALVDIDRAFLDGALAGTGFARQPDKVSNALQLFQRDWQVNNKAKGQISLNGIMGYEDSSAIDRAMVGAIVELLGFIETAMLKGFFQAETSVLPSRMGGLDHFINTTATTNAVDAGLTTLDETEINDLVEKLLTLNAAASGNWLLLMSYKNSRRPGALRYAKTTFTEVRDEVGAGTVTRFNSELAGVSMEIMGHPRMPHDRIFLLDRDKIRLIPTANVRDGVGPIPGVEQVMQGQAAGWSWMVPASTPGAEHKKFVMRAEVSMEIDNATTHHGVVRRIAP